MSDSVATLVTLTILGLGIAVELMLLLQFRNEGWPRERSEQRRARREPRSRSEHLVGRFFGRRHALVMSAACILPPTLHSHASAQPAAAGSSEPDRAASPQEQEAPAHNWLPHFSFQLNLDATTAYFYRGIIQEDSGWILQPAARVNVTLHENPQFKLDAFFSTWNSLHGQKTGADQGPALNNYWYESDLAGGVSLTKGPLTLTTSYTLLASPSDAFESVEELGFTLALDDSTWLESLALKPYATIAFEIGSNASDGKDSDPGTYLELGIGPGFSFDVQESTIAITFPVAVGMSLNDYYQDAQGDDDFLGFVQAGVRASIPLGSRGAAGAWSLNVGASMLLLGDHTREYNGGEDAEFIGVAGLQWNF
ncbi:MAG TPA: hypothetical protein VK176_10845 [Phycisphaerales bacterium]|nr:hypothetical protein [Phycisphaerales bacterium]